MGHNWIEFFLLIQCSWVTTLITSHSQTHFLSTSQCLILSATLLCAEMPGIGNTSRNYTRGEVSKRRLKQTASGIGSSCTCCTSSPVAARVYFCATFRAFRPLVVYHSRHKTVCPDTWPQVHLWEVDLHISHCYSVFL